MGIEPRARDLGARVLLDMYAAEEAGRLFMPLAAIGGSDPIALLLEKAVTSPSFASLDEADRQALVWGHLIEQLGDLALGPVEFVFTNAPGEVEAAE